MQVALYDVDSLIPNLALMKISAFHKERGDTVTPFVPLLKDQYDKVYASRIFHFSDASLLNPDQMEIGGTGWDLKKVLLAEIERMTPDYSFYHYPHSIGFAMRGCRFVCRFFIYSVRFTVCADKVKTYGKST